MSETLQPREGWVLPDTTGWYSIEFEVSGHKFASKIDPRGDMYPRIATLPAGMFEAMNIMFISNWGDIRSEEHTSELQSH